MGAVVRAQLGEDVSNLPLDRFLADSELRRDLLVRVAVLAPAERAAARQTTLAAWMTTGRVISPGTSG
jgi:hypothetical protein